MPAPPRAVHTLTEVYLPGVAEAQTIRFSQNGCIESISATQETGHNQSSERFNADGLLAVPSLCHPHVHLDKPHLFTHPATSYLRPVKGTFQEALSLTATAKALYTPESLLERMSVLLTESSRAGVTHIRGFVEVDASVEMMALDAAIEIQKTWSESMLVQICVFAQDPVFSGEQAATNRRLMETAVRRHGVEVLGSTPYVESSDERARANIEWAVRTAMQAGVHLDLHLDYNVDDRAEPLVWWVLKVLNREHWVERMPGKTVCLGHCTRLTLFTIEEWKKLREQVKALPVYFVGLPTSDIFMMGRPPGTSNDDSAQLAALADRKRCTIQVPAMIDVGIDACVGINNICNAFTPYGSTDPLALAQLCVGIYQTATIHQVETLYECISTRAKEAIGVRRSRANQTALKELLSLCIGDGADILLLGNTRQEVSREARRHKHICDILWDTPTLRKTIYRGRCVNS